MEHLLRQTIFSSKHRFDWLVNGVFIASKGKLRAYVYSAMGNPDCRLK